LIADFCTLPWQVLATTRAPDSRLLVFSRASGNLIGSTELPPDLTTPLEHHTLLAVDSDDPRGELHEPMRACVITGAALGHPMAPADTLAVCGALLRAGRCATARNLLKVAKDLSPRERSCGWSALGLEYVSVRDWHGAADAFSRVDIPGDTDDIQGGEGDTPPRGVPFAEAALLVAEAAGAQEHCHAPCNVVDNEVCIPL
jgi:hypothetical protein